MRILVTGSNGLIGQALCSVLEQSGYQVLRVVRKSSTPSDIQVSEIDETTNWDGIPDQAVDAVVHLAALVPPINNNSAIPAAQYHQINTLGTANFAVQCASKGIKRFVYISTIKVMGEGRDQPYRSDDPAVPDDAYAISKWEAEQALNQISKDKKLGVVILRPPLVYGPGVKGNFLRLLQIVDKHNVLPLGSIQNQRSLIYLGNLVDAIRVCLTHPAAEGKTFMVSDGDDVSTPELIRRVAAALGRKILLLPVPIAWMKWVGTLLGKQSSVDRIAGSLSVDIKAIQNDLNWSPPYTMRSGLASTVAWYRKQETRS